MSRTALLMSVAEFGPPNELGAEPELDEWSPLELAHENTDRLRRALESFGYVTDHVTDRAVLSDAPGLGTLVLERIRETHPETVLIVHVASHGVEAERSKTLLVVGADGGVEDNDVEAWIRAIEDHRDRRPLTLFLIDVCHAGKAARLPWQSNGEVDPHSFTLAAALPEESAYDCAFTAAVAQTLEEIASEELGLHPSTEWVPWETFRNRVRQLVSPSQTSTDQHVVATLLDSDKTPRFFANPAYREPDELHRQLVSLPAPVAAFADDELIDRTHFTDRAGGRTENGQPGAGLFTGRSQQLDDLTTWLDYIGVSAGNVRVVTGSPGAGKSALTGVIVCAAHPGLRDVTRTVWQHLRVPSRHEALAAIHARRRNLDEIFDSVARQWGLISPGRWTTVDFVEAVRALDPAPVLVLDALDEAEDTQAIIDGLLRPLIGAVDPEGLPVCRVLLGSRSGDGWPHVQALVEEVEQHDAGAVIDLDLVDGTVLREDLRQYAETVLSRTPSWDSVQHAAIRDEIATNVAGTLAPDNQDHPAPWGAFLVATLFLNYVTGGPPPASDAEVGAILGRLPRTLPEVLELDISRDEDQAQVRTVLRALAVAEGDGIPLTVLTDVCASLADRFPSPAERRVSAARPRSQSDTLEALQRVRFYLRSTVDTDGTSLFRLFHQGLSDYLATQVDDDDYRRVWAGLVDRQRNASGVPRWAGAEPYLKRHALAHAEKAHETNVLIQDWDFVLAAEPDRVLNALQAVPADVAVFVRAIYRSAAVEQGVQDPLRRRARLAVDAIRLGDHSGAAELLSEEGITLLWSSGGGRLSERHVGTFIGPMTPARPMGSAVLDGVARVISGEADGYLRSWDPNTREQTGPPVQAHTGEVWDVAGALRHLDAEADATAADADADADAGSASTTHREGLELECASVGEDGLLRFSTLGGTTPTVRTLHEHTGPLWSTALVPPPTDPAGTQIVLAGGKDGTLIFAYPWHTQSSVPVKAHSAGIVQIKTFELGGRQCAVTCSHDRTIHIWDLETRTIQSSVDIRGQWVAAVEFVSIEGRPSLLVGEASGTIRCWDLQTSRWVPPSFVGHEGRVSALAAVEVGSAEVVVSGGHDMTLRTWNLRQGDDDTANPEVREAGNVMRGHLDRIGALVTFSDPPGIAVSRGRGSDNTMRVWDLRTHQQFAPPSGHTGPVRAVAGIQLAGRDSAVSVGSNAVIIWDVESGTPERIWRADTANSMEVIEIAKADGPAAVMATTGGIRVMNLDSGETLSYSTPERSEETSTSAPVTSELSCVRVKRTPCAVFSDRHGYLNIYNLNTGTVRGKLSDGAAVPGSLSTFRSADGVARAAAGVSASTVRVWDIHRPYENSVMVGSVKLSSDDLVVTATTMFQDGDDVVVVATYSDGQVRMWDARTARLWGGGAFRLNGRGIGVTVNEVRGRAIAVFAMTDASIRVWDLRRLQEIASPLYLPAVPRSVQLSETGRLLYAYGVEVAALNINDPG